MSDFAQVIVRGATAPDAYEDFSAMLESSLAGVGKYVLTIDVEDEQLQHFCVRYAQEQGLAHYFGGLYQPNVPVAHLVGFFPANLAKSFDIGNVQGLPRRPTLFLFDAKGVNP